MEAAEFATHDSMMAVQKIVPAPIPQSGDLFSCPDNVGEQNGRENPVGLHLLTRSREELLGLAENHIGIAEPREVIGVWQTDEPRLGYPISHVLAVPELYGPILRTMEDQRWNPNRRQDVPNVNFGIHGG
jgi:hypothetical protein